MQNLTIGFFGDSFCAIDVNPKHNKNETYIQKLKNHYNADIVNLGKGGSSIWDLILLQFRPLLINSKVPDICVFVWTEPDRLFHRSSRNINFATAYHNKNSDFLYEQACNYYKNFYDEELSHFQYVSALQYFDLTILSMLPKTTKIVHLWSVGKLKEKLTNDNILKINLKDIDYFYTWKNGIEIKPSLMYIALENRDIRSEQLHRSPNHIDGENKNNYVFEMIKNAIDNQ